MIIRGGYHVPARDRGGRVRPPGRAGGAVVGVPDDKMGEEVGAAIALKQGADCSEDEIRSFVKERVPATSIRGRSGSLMSCRRGRRGRFSSGRLRCRSEWRRARRPVITGKLAA